MLKVFEMLNYTEFDIKYWYLVDKIKHGEQNKFTEEEKKLYQYCIDEGLISIK